MLTISVPEESGVQLVCVLLTATSPLVEDVMVNITSVDGTAVSFANGAGV